MLEHTVRLMIVAGLGFGLFGCDKGEPDSAKAESKDSAGGEADPPKDPYATEGVAAGDSCKGIGASKGLITCKDNAVLVCSSFTNYTWKQQMECAEDTECVVDGKNAQCRKRS
jgi:hypothetical protein